MVISESGEATNVDSKEESVADRMTILGAVDGSTELRPLERFLLLDDDGEGDFSLGDVGHEYPSEDPLVLPERGILETSPFPLV